MRANQEDRLGDAPPPRRRVVLFALLALGMLVVLGFGLRALLGTKAPSEPVVTLAPPVATPAPAPAKTQPPEPRTPPEEPMRPPEPPPPPLPELEHSDPEVRSSLSDILPPVAQPSLEPHELLRRGAVLAASFAQGKLLRDKLPLPVPTGKLAVVTRDERSFLSEANFERYNDLADAFAELDADALARWFQRYEPLLQQAWSELGNEQGSVRGALIAGLDSILAAPDLQGEIELVRPSVFFKYADPAIEALPGLQKLMIRIGPNNRQLVKERARRLRDALAGNG